jgi:hypothetical protein
MQQKIGYAARLFYADAFIANQNLQVALISSVKVSQVISQPQKLINYGLNLYTPFIKI